MNEKKLRAEVEKQCTVTDEVWQYLEDHHHVEDALVKSFDEDQVAEIVKVIDRFKAMWGPTRAEKHLPKTPKSVSAPQPISPHSRFF